MCSVVVFVLLWFIVCWWYVMLILFLCLKRVVFCSVGVMRSLLFSWVFMFSFIDGSRLRVSLKMFLW